MQQTVLFLNMAEEDPAARDVASAQRRAPFANMNGLFDRTTLLPMKGYYPFYVWSKLAALGTQVVCDISGGPGAVPAASNSAGPPQSGLRAVAARGPDGSGAVIIARYAEDNNVTATIRVLENSEWILELLHGELKARSVQNAK